jgi:heme/copper-type cytochrome/quinol oxidase subunit 2
MLRPPLIALLIAAGVLLVAVGLGLWFRAVNPYGIWLYTPQDWCAASRADSFALVYGAVTATGVVAFSLLTFVLRIRSRRSRLSSASHARSRWISITAWSASFAVVLVLLTPVSSNILPNVPDPSCHATST